MITVRPSQERGQGNFDWLESYHTFSFGHYYDPRFMNFSCLRVINEDKVAPGQGFATHGHRDMEIVTYVLEGELEHKDNICNGSIMRPGDVQRMSAGTGILHSEFNPSKENRVHLLQIWILPGQMGIEPSYEQKFFAPTEKQGQLRLVASPNGRDGSVTIHQDAAIYASILAKGQTIHYSLGSRSVWVQVTRGAIAVKGQSLQAGDAAGIQNEIEITITGSAAESEFLLFDLP